MKKKNLFIIILIFILNIIICQDYYIHKVKEGETLWRICKNYNASFDEILKLNNIDDVAKIKSGSNLKIPDNKQDKLNNENQVNKKTMQFKFHNLKKNETLWSLSKKYNVTVEELCGINKISDITKIKKNAKIKIPVRLEFLEYKPPIKNGEIIESNSAHFKGIYIFSKNENENINSIEKGVVSYIDNISGYGITLFIRHDNGLVSTYAGFKEIYLKPGDIVKSNQVIGKIGKISRYDKFGILFAIQYKGTVLEFNKEENKFVKPMI